MRTYMKYVATLLGLLFMGTASAVDLSIRSFYAGAGAGYATSDAVCDYSDTRRDRDSGTENRDRLAPESFDNRLEEDIAPDNFVDTLPDPLVLPSAPNVPVSVTELAIRNFDSVSRDCDDSDVSWKVFGGMKFGDYFGVEVGYADFGETSAVVSSSEPSVVPQIFIDTDEDGITDANFRARTNTDESHLPVNGSISVEGEQDTVFFAGLLRYNIYDNFEIFLKGGAHYWEVEMNAFGTYRVGDENPRTYRGATHNNNEGGMGPHPSDTDEIIIPAGVTTDSGNIPSLRVDDDGVDPFFGIGLGYTMDNGLGFRAEWERYYFDIDLPQTDATDPNLFRRELEDEVDVFTLSVLYHFSL